MSEAAASPAAAPSSRREVLWVACGAHALHHGCADLLYVLLPIWQAAFGLDYASVGALRALAQGTLAGLQVPAGRLAGRVGPTLVLAGGTATVGLGYFFAGGSTGLPSLSLALVLIGIGLSTQHPISSILVAEAYGARPRVALGTYNFAGDIGKMVVPASGAWLIALLAWRPSVTIIGALGILAAAVITVRLRPLDSANAAPAPSPTIAAPQPRVRLPRAFYILLAIGIVDSATRMGFLTFLPFLLKAKGADLPMVGIALTLVFAGGAAGKFVCSYLGERLGVPATVYLTEGLTALGIVALLPSSLGLALALLPAMGVMLNGTSSVLYGTVPELAAGRREHAFGIFYTGTIGAGALAPVIYGFFGNFVGLYTMMAIVSAVVLTTLPLARLLRPALSRIA